MSNKCTEMKPSSHGNIILKYPAAACANQFDKRTWLKYEKIHIKFILT